MIVNLTLARSGLLHVAGRCGVRHGYTFGVGPGEDVVGFLYLKFTGLCRRCVRGN